MSSYCALLGHQPHISLAELNVLLPDMKIDKLWSQQIITFTSKTEIDSDWLRNAGGTVLIAKEISSNKKTKELESIVPQMLYKELKDTKRKATFSFRCFGIPRSKIRSLYKDCKQFLKEKSMPSRYIGNDRNPAKPGTLMLRGIPGADACELLLINDIPNKKKKSKSTKDDIWIGKTCAVQDIKEYSERDVNKPFRDTNVGLLPPKLAQIMINLSQMLTGKETKGLTIWDPFCGSGVIALETLIKKSNILASDKSIKAVNGCTENIKWLRKKDKTPKAITSEIWKQDALKSCELPKIPDCIVTETTLGPPLKKTPTKREVATLIREAEKIEVGFFENMKEMLPDTPIICCFPVYITRDGEKNFLPKAIQKIQKLGYRITCVSNKYIKATSRHSLLYLRNDQHVGREILCFLPPGSKASGKKN
ncbi:hypothetical protein HOF56_00515 [Candidatus Peribacteria bacterium]|jgi:tRNA G10  N-methylase Trm11|nr:hypothetical protein [Candidatus Peribacteria bacterium]MBT4020886.1 hypothetical protein [Candidatus Peribacteria bacterium]MBT4240972.1 hypothetical protein [Candidatus Peribacteria bacterium]MBT4473885.1 hypothetical protein [Candidatus Peribacteria bacterium]